MIKAAIIVGHIGKGTGSSHQDLDEWEQAKNDAYLLYYRLLRSIDIRPLIFVIDRKDLFWKILGKHLTDESDDYIKANWIKESKPDCVIDLHYNSFKNTLPHGHEIITPSKDDYLGKCMDTALDILPNKHRSKIVEAHMRLFRHLKGSGIPSVILEPAFIFNPCVRDDSFHQRFITAMEWGLTRFGKKDLDEAIKNNGVSR